MAVWAAFTARPDSGDFDHVVAVKVIKGRAAVRDFGRALPRRAADARRSCSSQIARLYYGGETADGAPYLVMEYVDGLPLLGWPKTRTAGVSVLPSAA